MYASLRSGQDRELAALEGEVVQLAAQSQAKKEN